MRFLLANGRLAPGSGPEKYMFALRQHLQARGHEVFLVGTKYKGTEVPEGGYGIEPVTPGGKVLFDEYKGEMTVWDALRIVGRQAYSRAVGETVRRVMREQKIDVVYGINIQWLSPTVIAAAAREGKPCILRVSDFALFCPSYAFLREGHPCYECAEKGLGRALRYRCVQGSLAATIARVGVMYWHRAWRVYEKVQRFVVTNTYLGDWMTRFCGDAEKVAVIKTFSPHVDREYERRQRGHFLYVGRISPEKGMEVLLKAFQGSGARYPLKIAGWGPPSYVERLKRNYASAKVVWLGFVSPKGVVELARGAVAMVVPSLCHENGPNVVIEAQSVGTPVIGSDVPGIKEYAAPGGSIIVPAGSDDELAEAIRRLDRGPEVVEELGREALVFAQREFDADRHYEKLMAVVEEARAKVRSA